VRLKSASVSTTVAAIGLTVLFVAGCSKSQQAATVGTAPVVVPTDAPKASAPAPAPGQALSAAQLKAALLTAAETPAKGWTLKKPSPSPSPTPSSSDVIAPAKCQEFITAMGGRSVNKTAKATARVEMPAGTTFAANVISEQIDSYDTTPDSTMLSSRNDLYDACKTFTSTDAKGITSTFQILPLAMANHGDQSVALRMQGQVSIFTVVVDLVWVRIGNNTVQVSQVGLGGIDPKLTPKVVAAAVAKLSRVASAS